MDKLGKVDEFLETHNLPKLNQEQIENMNRANVSRETESETTTTTKPSSQGRNKNPGPDKFIGKFYQTFKGKSIPILLKLFQKREREGKFLNTFFEALPLY